MDGGDFWLGTMDGNKEKVLSNRSEVGTNSKLRWASGRWSQQSMDLMELDAFRGKPAKVRELVSREWTDPLLKRVTNPQGARDLSSGKGNGFVDTFLARPNPREIYME